MSGKTAGSCVSATTAASTGMGRKVPAGSGCRVESSAMPASQILRDLLGFLLGFGFFALASLLPQLRPAAATTAVRCDRGPRRRGGEHLAAEPAAGRIGRRLGGRRDAAHLVEQALDAVDHALDRLQRRQRPLGDLLEDVVADLL